MKLLDKIQITLRSRDGSMLPFDIDVFDNSLSRKWLTALNTLLSDQYLLEKNYCWFGFPEGERNATFLCEQINHTIAEINKSDLGYIIHGHFTVENTIADDLGIDHDKMNQLHRYFEDLQGTSDNISPYYKRATPEIKWHIRQLNLLCHEHESLILSMRKALQAPEWRRPSQLMCWLNAPRYTLDENDYELFGIETLSRKAGGVYVGVNKAVGKHHWEVFTDEGRDSRIDELTTTTLKSQTEAAGDFNIEWAKDPTGFNWQEKQLQEFREWLTVNGFDPNDKSLTIGHPQVGQVDLESSFRTQNLSRIWNVLNKYLDVYSIVTSDATAVYDYRWDDSNFIQRQINALG